MDQLFASVANPSAKYWILPTPQIKGTEREQQQLLHVPGG